VSEASTGCLSRKLTFVSTLPAAEEVMGIGPARTSSASRQTHSVASDFTLASQRQTGRGTAANAEAGAIRVPAAHRAGRSGRQGWVVGAPQTCLDPGEPRHTIKRPGEQGRIELPMTERSGSARLSTLLAASLAASFRAQRVRVREGLEPRRPWPVILLIGLSLEINMCRSQTWIKCPRPKAYQLGMTAKSR
jgi:hypothetical protein